MRRQGVRVPVPQFVFRLQQAHPFHVLELTGLFQDFHPVRYGFTVGFFDGWKVRSGVSRLSSEEQYKGYDQVINVLKKLNTDQTIIKYIIAGKADVQELSRVKQLITEQGLSDKVILTGFVKEQELIDHYLLADIFVLPSKGEGFGIVLIEALACGRKLIAGNKDGSVDALMNGELGTLVDPDDLDQLKLAIIDSLNDIKYDSLTIQESAQNNFGFHLFKNRILDYLSR